MTVIVVVVVVVVVTLHALMIQCHDISLPIPESCSGKGVCVD